MSERGMGQRICIICPQPKLRKEAGICLIFFWDNWDLRGWFSEGGLLSIEVMALKSSGHHVGFGVGVRAC